MYSTRAPDLLREFRMKTIASISAALLFISWCAGTSLSCIGKNDGIQTAESKGRQAGKSKAFSAEAKPGEIIVKFKPGVGEQRIGEIARKEGLEVIRVLRPPSVYLFKSRGTSQARETSQELLDKMITELRKYTEIEYAEPNYIARPARN